MESTPAKLLLLLGLSATAAAAIVVAIERGATLPVEASASAASQAAPAVVDTTPDKQVALMHQLAKTHLQHRDYRNAIIWAQRTLSAGGAETELRPLLAQAHFQLGDYANAARELQWEVQFAERAGRPPGEDRLLLLQRCYAQINDASAYSWGLEKLLTWYPSRKYWNELLGRMQNRPDFGAPQALDLNRLRLATGTLDGAPAYLALVAQVRDAGFPAEARQVVERGFASGVLGHGPEGGRHRQLLRQLAHELALQRQRIHQRDVLLAAQNAEDGSALFDRLHFGIAQLMAGQKDGALETFKLVRGKHAAPELARLWTLYARNVV